MGNIVNFSLYLVLLVSFMAIIAAISRSLSGTVGSSPASSGGRGPLRCSALKRKIDQLHDILMVGGY